MRRFAVPSIIAVLAAGMAFASPSSAAEITAAHHTGQVLLRFAPSASSPQRAEALARVGARVEGLLASLGVYVIRLAPGDTTRAAVDRWSRNPLVEFVEPDFAMTLGATPNDTSYTSLWGLNNTGQSGGKPDADVDAPEGWDLLGTATGSPWPTSSFTVGVVDTGINTSHADLAGKAVTPCASALVGNGSLVDGCPDDNGHGTHVSGTIAAVGNNGQGVVGVAPNARVLACKALDAGGSGWTSDIAACVDFLTAKRDLLNLRVISMSLGGPSSSTMLAAVDRAWNAGVLVVAAAGNDGSSIVRYPAGYANVVSVAATDRYDARASFSNFNADVELAAPGVSILSTVPGGYASWSGTSMATPHVAGVAANVAWKTGKTGQALRDALTSTADDLGTAGRDTSFGYGRVNLCRALGGCGGSPSPSPSPSPVPSQTGTLAGTGYYVGRTRTGIVVSWTGAASGNTKTGAYGAYSATVASGSYTVTAKYRTRVCRANSNSGPTSLSVNVPAGGTTTVNWYC